MNRKLKSSPKKKVVKKEKILLFDTTLRDGEQSPGFSMDIEEKVQIALALEKLKVDVIEVGFPISSNKQFEACQVISKRVTKPILAGLCRVIKKDIEAVYQSLKNSRRWRIHTFVATSDIHMKHKFNKSKKEVLQMVKEGVGYASSLVRKSNSEVADVQFSAEDATRSNYSFLLEVVQTAIDHGATTINIPDTVGYTTPMEYKELFQKLTEEFKDYPEVVFSAHCHNDLGFAVANSLFAVEAGARQIECTINGIGERAGNASLEEIAMAIKTRNEIFPYRCDINTKNIYPISKLLSNISGIDVQPNKAIVGSNAFSHESGIHQHGVIKNKSTYEIINPENIGYQKFSNLTLGRHSGVYGLQKSLEMLKIKTKEESFNKIFKDFSKVADKRKYLTNDDIIQITNPHLPKKNKIYLLSEFMMMSHSNKLSVSHLKINYGQETIIQSSSGKGPIEACYSAINQIFKKRFNKNIKLLEYKISAMASGITSQGDVEVILEINNKIYSGKYYDEDIIIASIKAYLGGVNLFLLIGNKEKNYGKKKR